MLELKRDCNVAYVSKCPPVQHFSRRWIIFEKKRVEIKKRTMKKRDQLAQTEHGCRLLVDTFKSILSVAYTIIFSLSNSKFSTRLLWDSLLELSALIIGSSDTHIH